MASFGFPRPALTRMDTPGLDTCALTLGIFSFCAGQWGWLDTQGQARPLDHSPSHSRKYFTVSRLGFPFELNDTKSSERKSTQGDTRMAEGHRDFSQ